MTEQRTGMGIGGLNPGGDPYAPLLAALERIAWPEFEKDANGHPVGCRCGHRYDMCNAVNAARWCGGDALRAEIIARRALGYYDDLGLITPKGQARFDELRTPTGDGSAES